MIYEVTLRSRAIDEIVTTSADNEQQAIERAVWSAIQRMLKEGTASAEAVNVPTS